MTVETQPYRLRPHEVAMISPGGGIGQVFVTRVNRPLDDIDLGEVFRNISQLQATDKVEMIAFDEAAGRVVEECACRIVYAGPEEPGGPRVVRASWIGEAVKHTYSPPMSARKAAKERKLDIRKEFDGEGRPGGYTVRDDRGAVIEHFKTKREAQTYVDRLNGAPEPEAAKEAA